MLREIRQTRRSFVLGSAAGAATLAGCSTSGTLDVKETKLAIIHTNDTHGYDLLSDDDESVGLAAVAQLKADWQAKGYEVLVVDAGDAVQGTNLVNFSSGATAIDFMNEVGYDVMALGNHEFDFGQDKVEGYIHAANFPILAANIIVQATGRALAEEHTILTLGDGTKIGFFGLTTPQTYTGTNPLLVEGLTFYESDDLYACAQEQADALRKEGCALVVCLAHLGEADGAAPNRAMDVVANVSGVDLYIDGHDHEEEEQVLKDKEGNSTLVVETGCYTHAIGVITWEDGKLEEHLQRFGKYEGQDAAVAASIQEVQDKLNKTLSEEVATTPFDLNGERSPGVRTEETNFGDLIADALLWEGQLSAEDQPVAAIVNGGAIRESIHKGDITRGDVLDALPFISFLCTVQVTGAQLLEAIEAACATTPEAMGSFPQVAGIEYTVDTTVPYENGEQYPDSTYYAPANPGARVTITKVGDGPFSQDETYTITAGDFICMGGDTYYVFAEAAQKTMKSTGYLCYDVLEYYLKDPCAGEVPQEYAEPQARITVIA